MPKTKQKTNQEKFWEEVLRIRGRNHQTTEAINARKEELTIALNKLNEAPLVEVDKPIKKPDFISPTTGTQESKNKKALAQYYNKIYEASEKKLDKKDRGKLPTRLGTSTQPQTRKKIAPTTATTATAEAKEAKAKEAKAKEAKAKEAKAKEAKAKVLAELKEKAEAKKAKAKVLAELKEKAEFESLSLFDKLSKFIKDNQDFKYTEDNKTKIKNFNLAIQKFYDDPLQFIENSGTMKLEQLLFEIAKYRQQFKTYQEFLELQDPDIQITKIEAKISELEGLKSRTTSAEYEYFVKEISQYNQLISDYKLEIEFLKLDKIEQNRRIASFNGEKNTVAVKDQMSQYKRIFKKYNLEKTEDGYALLGEKLQGFRIDGLQITESNDFESKFIRKQLEKRKEEINDELKSIEEKIDSSSAKDDPELNKQRSQLQAEISEINRLLKVSSKTSSQFSEPLYSSDTNPITKVVYQHSDGSTLEFENTGGISPVCLKAPMGSANATVIFKNGAKLDLGQDGKMYLPTPKDEKELPMFTGEFVRQVLHKFDSSSDALATIEIRGVFQRIQNSEGAETLRKMILKQMIIEYCYDLNGKWDDKQFLKLRSALIRGGSYTYAEFSNMGVGTVFQKTIRDPMIRDSSFERNLREKRSEGIRGIVNNLDTSIPLSQSSHSSPTSFMDYCKRRVQELRHPLDKKDKAQRYLNEIFQASEEIYNVVFGTAISNSQNKSEEDNLRQAKEFLEEYFKTDKAKDLITEVRKKRQDPSIKKDSTIVINTPKPKN